MGRGPQGAIFSEILATFQYSLGNVQLISDKTKTIFVMPYPYALMGENISIFC